jgi:PAS domain S-box-containing protein
MSETQDFLHELRMLKEAIDQHAIISIADASGNIIHVNDKFCQVSKYSRAELTGKNHRMLKSGIHDAKFFDELWQTISSGRTWHGDICNRNKEGGLYWVASTIVPSLDENGLPRKYISIRTEITGVKQIEAELALGKAELEKRVWQRTAELEDALRASKLAHDEAQAHYAVMKMAQAEMRQSEADKNKQMDALAEANVRMVLFHATMEELRRYSASLTHVGEEFSYKVLRDAMSLTGAKYGAMGLFDADGKLGKFLTEGISEAERQKIGAYPAGKGLLHALFKEGMITRVNCIADDPRSCGFPPGHPPMNNLLGVPLMVNGITKGVIYMTDKHSGEPFSESDEMYMDLLTTEVMHVLERSELMGSLHDSNRALMQEKSEQHKLITQLQEAQSHLLQSEKMASIGQLAAGVAHEINNPIGYVYSNLGTLEKYVQDLIGMLANYEQAEGVIADAEVRSRLQTARQKLDLAFIKEDLRALMDESKDGITRVKNIVQNLKDFSHVDAADEWQYADLHAGLNSTLNIVNNEIKYKADVVKEYGDLPQVECLPSQLNQVFMNLLVNASHAIEERGLITVRTGQAGEEVWVEVEDTGKGIAPENLQKIFDPFFTTKPIGKGTGLGLSLSYGIVQKHNGRIEVQSEAGKGTKFRVWLPLRHVQKD